MQEVVAGSRCPGEIQRHYLSV